MPFNEIVLDLRVISRTVWDLWSYSIHKFATRINTIGKETHGRTREFRTEEGTIPALERRSHSERESFI